MGNYYVYIMASRSGTLYIGATNDLLRRVSEHKLCLTEGFTKKYRCQRLVYYEHFSAPHFAIHREKELKGWRREKKEDLVATTNPTWRDLTWDLGW